mgnify:FL=1
MERRGKIMNHQDRLKFVCEPSKFDDTAASVLYKIEYQNQLMDNYITEAVARFKGKVTHVINRLGYREFVANFLDEETCFHFEQFVNEFKSPPKPKLKPRRQYSELPEV